MITTIHVKNLRLRTFIGFNEEEREKRQDVVINIWLDYNAQSAVAHDEVSSAVNYKTITKNVIKLVEDNRFLLLETLTSDILDIVRSTRGVTAAKVEVDKPHALRFSDSVSCSLSFQTESN